MLPLFNKAIRKFSKLIKEVFERDIQEEMNRDEEKSKKVLSGVALNKEAASNLGSQSLAEELKTGNKLTDEMQAQKDKFIQKHKIKKSHQEMLEDVKMSGNATVVSIPRKRSDNEDEDGDLAAIE